MCRFYFNASPPSVSLTGRWSRMVFFSFSSLFPIGRKYHEPCCYLSPTPGELKVFRKLWGFAVGKLDRLFRLLPRGMVGWRRGNNEFRMPGMAVFFFLSSLFYFVCSVCVCVLIEGPFFHWFLLVVRSSVRHKHFPRGLLGWMMD